MFYKKKNFPEESELVTCTVKKVLPHSVFVSLDEYEKLEGMIHLSEVSPGRIRNIRDFVIEGKKLVCKILRVDRSKKHIDLSLRRVSISQRNKKREEVKQEEKSEKILEKVANNFKMGLKDVYSKIGTPIIENYGSLTKTFYLILENKTDLSELNIPEEYRKELIKIVKEKIKIPEVKISGKLILKNEQGDGIEKIKKILFSSQEFAKKKKYNLKLSYLGAPKYKLEITAKDFKTAENILKETTERISKEMDKLGGYSEFLR